MSARSRVYPVSLLLEGRPCLVVGGRQVAHQRATGLLEVGACVTVIAPDVIDELSDLAVTVLRRGFRDGDTTGFELVVSATGDAAIDALVHADARASGALVNAVDNPAACDLYLPAVLRRGAISVAISTDGASPALASWIRNRVAGSLSDELEAVAEIVATTREAVRSSGTSSEGLDWATLIEALVTALKAGESEQDAGRIAAAWLTAKAAAPDAGDGGARLGDGAPDG